MLWRIQRRRWKNAAAKVAQRQSERRYFRVHKVHLGPRLDPHRDIAISVVPCPVVLVLGRSSVEMVVERCDRRSMFHVVCCCMRVGQ